MKKRYFLSAVLILALFTVLTIPACKAAITQPPVTLNVSAASSLNKVLNELNALYVKQNPNVTIVPDYSSAGDLETKIESGAAADIFFPDSEARMDNLQNKGLIVDSTRKDLLNNQLVLIVPASNPLGLSDFGDIAFYYANTVAIANPDSDSSGVYALQAFTELAIAYPLSSKEIEVGTTADVMNAVANNTVDAGVVYATDVLT